MVGDRTEGQCTSGPTSSEGFTENYYQILNSEKGRQEEEEEGWRGRGSGRESRRRKNHWNVRVFHCKIVKIRRDRRLKDYRNESN